MYQFAGKKHKDKLHGPVSPALQLRHDASAHLSSRSYRDAESTYKKLLILNPGSVTGVLQDFERALLKDMDNVDLKMSLVDIYFFLENWPEARYELEEVLDLDPRQPDAYLKLARILQKVDPDQIVPLFEMAYQYLPNEIEIVDGLVTAYVSQQDYPKAIRIYQGLLTRNGESPRVIKILAELYTMNHQRQESAATYLLLLKNKGCLQEVVQRLEELLAMDPDNIFILQSLADVYGLEMKPEHSLKLLEKVCLLDGDLYEDTIKRIKKILAQYPDYVPALVAMGYMYIHIHLYSEAVMCFYQLMKSNSRYLDEAVTGYKAVLEICPQQVLARQYLGEAYMNTREFDLALHEFDLLIDYNTQDAGLVMTKCRSILKEEPENMAARTLLAKCYFVREEYKKTYNECALINEQATHKVLVDTYMLRVKSCFELARYDESFKYLQDLIGLNAASRVVHEFVSTYMDKLISAQLETEKDMEQNSPGQYYLLLGKRAFIRDDLEEAIRSFQLSSRDQSVSGISYYLLGICFKVRGRFDLAINQFNRAYELAASQSNYAKMNIMRYNTGLTYEASGDLKGATENYEKILENDISFTSIKKRIAEINKLSWGNLAGRALVGIERDLDSSDIIVVWAPGGQAKMPARKEKRLGMVMDISFSQSHNDDGVNHFLKGRIKAAEDEFHLAVQLDSNFTVVYNNLGLLHLEKHDYEEALKHLERALEDAFDEGIVHANLGLLHYCNGELDSAKEHYHLALACDPQLSLVHINLGDICYKQGEIDKAINHWVQAYNNSTVPELAFKRLLFKRPAFSLDAEIPVP